MFSGCMGLPEEPTPSSFAATSGESCAPPNPKPEHLNPSRTVLELSSLISARFRIRAERA